MRLPHRLSDVEVRLVMRQLRWRETGRLCPKRVAVVHRADESYEMSDALQISTWRASPGPRQRTPCRCGGRRTTPEPLRQHSIHRRRARGRADPRASRAQPIQTSRRLGPTRSDSWTLWSRPATPTAVPRGDRPLSQLGDSDIGSRADPRRTAAERGQRRRAVQAAYRPAAQCFRA